MTQPGSLARPPAALPLLVLLAMLVLCAGSVVAADTDWSALSSDEQALLKRFAGEWDSLSQERRERLVTGARRWQGMTPEERETARQRLQKWRSLSAEEQDIIRSRIKDFRRLPPEERERITRNFRYYQSLPAEQREKLRKRWLKLTPEQRKELLRNRDVEQQRRRQQLDGAGTPPETRGEGPQGEQQKNQPGEEGDLV